MHRFEGDNFVCKCLVVRLVGVFFLPNVSYILILFTAVKMFSVLGEHSHVPSKGHNDFAGEFLRMCDHPAFGKGLKIYHRWDSA